MEQLEVTTFTASKIGFYLSRKPISCTILFWDYKGIKSINSVTESIL